MMDLEYQYCKVRHNFGRQPMFCETKPVFLDTVAPDKLEQKKFCLRNPVHQAVQVSAPLSIHKANTIRTKYVTTGTNHREGGWPQDVDCTDEESTQRHIRRVQRNDNYAHAIISLSPDLKHLIDQNNNINVYEHYFKYMPEFESFEDPAICRLNSCKDPFFETDKRPVACIDWTIEDNPKMVVAYCNKKYPDTPRPVNTKLECYIWDLNKKTDPIFEFLPPSACWQLVCSPVSSDTIIGGLEDGRVCIFDSRNGKEPVDINATHLAHKEPITSLIYIESRNNNEFFSGSTDGICLWYDIRNLTRPIDSLFMSVLIPPGEVPNISNVEPISALQYLKTTPTRFLCGTDTGLVINVNRKGKSHKETMASLFEAHLGPVKALQRNPFISKMLLSCGDWTTHIWNDEIITSPIITGTSHRYQTEDVAWAPGKVSGYMTVGKDGKFRYWDLLKKIQDPIIVMPMSKCALLKIKPQNDGRIVAIGDEKGTIYMISLSDNLIRSGDRDKQMMMQIFERETRREHILDLRVREIRLKTTATTTGTDTFIDAKEEEDNYEAEMEKVEQEYREKVIDEIKHGGIPSMSAAAGRRVSFK